MHHYKNSMLPVILNSITNMWHSCYPTTDIRATRLLSISLFCKLFAVVSVEHSQLGLEARRWCRVPGRAEARFHSTELPCSWILDADGKPLHHAIIQSRTLSLSLSP